MTSTELSTLKENYVEYIIDGADLDSLVQMCRDCLLDAYANCSEDEIVEEIKDLYDDEVLSELLPQ
jgi:hypothetical protein